MSHDSPELTDCPVFIFIARQQVRYKMRSGADQNGDNLRISRACLRISDHCRVTVRVRAGLTVRVGIKVWVRVRVRVRERVRVTDCCIQTASVWML